MNWYFEVLNKYATFDGRAHREEYWMFSLINLVICILLIILDVALAFNKGLVLYALYVIAVFIPHTAVGVRRMHDTDHSGWWLLLPIVNFIFLVLDSQNGDNRFGPNPKADIANSPSKIIQPQTLVSNNSHQNFIAVNEDELYEIVANEIETGKTQKGLWTKLYAQCDGDETQIKVRYIEQRVAQLKDAEMQKHSVLDKVDKKTSQPSANNEDDFQGFLNKHSAIEKERNFLTHYEELQRRQIEDKEELAFYGITFDGEKYNFQSYKYDKRDDAIRYAKLVSKKNS